MDSGKCPLRCDGNHVSSRRDFLCGSTMLLAGCSFLSGCATLSWQKVTTAPSQSTERLDLLPRKIAAIRKACSISTEVLDRSLKHINPGMTEKDLAELLDLETKNLGLTKGTFTIVAFGPNTTEPHHYPTESKLKQNDTILIDYWAKCDGYYSDITRCFAIGAPTDLYMEVYRVVERAQASAIELIKDGVKVKIIDEAAREVISTSGYPNYEHPTGHGIGLEIHESPFLNSKSDVKLRTGDVITVEPGVYIPGKFGIRIEDDVLVTETGYEVLTSHCPHEPLLTSHTD